ncbi:MAG: signal peptidase II [Minisyncoccota bacterium]
MGKSHKVLLVMLSVVFFLCLHFVVSAGLRVSSLESLCNIDGPLGMIISNQWFFLLNVIILGGVVWQMQQSRDITLLLLAWTLILIGGLSNVLERWLFGCIMDYRVFPSLPLFFNLADVWLTLGALLLIFCSYYEKGNSIKTMNKKFTDTH